MVAHVLSLRAALLVGAMRGDRSAVMRTIGRTLLFLVAAAAVLWGVLQLAKGTAEVAHAVIVTAGSALVLGCLVAPLMSGAQDQLDPRKFSVLGVDSAAFPWTLLVGSLVSVPSLVLFAGCGIAAMVWIDLGVSAGLAVTCAVLAALTCLLASRVSMLVSSLWIVHRSREITGLFILSIVVIVVPVVVFLMSLQWGGVVPSQFAAAADILSHTPLGAVWAAPGNEVLDNGSVVPAILIAIATVLALAATWYLLVRHAMQTIPRPSAAKERYGMGWFALLPATPAGGIAARSLVYWLRDRRYLINIVIVPLIAVAAALPLLIAGVPLGIVLLLPVPIMALFFGWIPHNDVAYDSTAVWMHIVAGVRGIADRLGRLVPILLIALPILAIATPIAVALYGRWAVLPALIGVEASLFFAGLGLSSISSVIAPYAATRPGDSPFQQPQRTGSGVGSQALTLLGAIAVSLPVIFLGYDVLMGDVEKADQAMWLGLGIGAAVFAVGVIVGAILWDRRGSQIMEFAESS